ncbi:MAG: Ltp family lipoprotein [Synergistaceae bacterium]|nr:Ltp family lipoprotein [Synergistaceae bacterium]
MKKYFALCLLVLLVLCVPAGGASLGELNTLASAKIYLSNMAFSYKGLVTQLEFEGYSHSEAEYAVKNCGADWNEQAAKKAKEYLDMMPMSRSGLIQQLVFEGFTKQQASYGVKQAGY